MNTTPNASQLKGYGQFPPALFPLPPSGSSFYLFTPCSQLSTAKHPPALQPASTNHPRLEQASSGPCGEGSLWSQLPTLLLPAPANLQATLGVHPCVCVCADKTGVVRRAERHVLGCCCLVKLRSWLEKPIKNSPSCNAVKH